MTTESELDALLSAPLEAVDDAGFSRALARKIAAQEAGVAWFELGAAIAVLALIVLFMPVARLAAPFETVAIDLGLSLPFAIACATLVVAHAALRFFAD